MKKSIQKALSFLFALSILISGAPLVNLLSVDANANAATEELTGGPNDAYKYNVYTSSGEERIRITGVDDVKLSGEIVIPDTIDNKPVVIITDFDNANVTKVTIPKSVEAILYDAFKDCEFLEEFEVEEGNDWYTSVDGVLFQRHDDPANHLASLHIFPRNKAYNNYEIPEYVTINSIEKEVYKLSECAFFECNKLTGTLTIPERIASYYNPSEARIEPESFYGCTGIEFFKVNVNIEEVGNAYYFSDENGVLYSYLDGSLELLAYPTASKRKSYRILDGTKELASNDGRSACFKNADYIEEVIIPASVEEIGANVFHHCDNLKRVTFEERTDGQTLVISYNSFVFCNNLSEINLPGTLTKLSSSSLQNVTIYFDGTEEEWNAVMTNSNNHTEYVVFFKDSGRKTSGDVSLIYNGNEYENVELIVNEISSSDYETAFENNSFEIWKKDYEIIASRQIKVKVDGAEVKQFDSPITLVFDIPEEYRNISSNRFAIYHLSSVDGYEIFDSTGDYKNLVVQNGKIYITVNSLSPFALGVLNSSGSSVTNKTVSSVSIKTSPEKVNYKGDLSGVELTVTYTDGTTETVTDTSKMTFIGFDNKKIGKQTVTVEYEGYTAEFEVTVSYAWWQWIIRILLLGFFWY